MVIMDSVDQVEASDCWNGNATLAIGMVCSLPVGQSLRPLLQPLLQLPMILLLLLVRLLMILASNAEFAAAVSLVVG